MIEAIAGYLNQNYDEILVRFFDFLNPFQNQSAKWIIIPVIVTIIVMEMYYVRYKNEEVGWNTATANSLVLMFVSMNLFKFLSEKNSINFTNIGSYDFSTSMLVLFILLEGLFLFIMDFSHFWPKFMAFHFSNHLTVNLTAYIAIIIVYSAIPLTMSVFIAATLFFLIINVVFFLFRIFY